MELWKIALTTSATLLGGVVLLVATQLLLRLVIEPVTEQLKAAANVDAKLLFWAWAYANPQEQKTPERDRAMDELRESSARMVAATNVIRWWRLARWWGAIPEDDADRAARMLFGVSNNVYGRYSRERRVSDDVQRIRQLLRLRIAARERGED